MAVLDIIMPSSGYPLQVSITLLGFLAVYLLYLTTTRRGVLPLNWPIVGMLPAIPAHLHHLLDYMTSVLDASGMTFHGKGPWFCNMNVIVTCDPANVNHVFNTHADEYPRGEHFREIFDLFGRSSLLTSDGDERKMHRRMIHNLMTDRHFREYELSLGRDKVEHGLVPLLRRHAEDGSAVDLQDLFGRLTFDTGCGVVLGADTGSLSPGHPAVPAAVALEIAEEAIFRRHFVPRNLLKLMKRLKLGLERKMEAAADVIDEFVSEQIARRREEMNSDLRDGKDLKADLLTTYLKGQRFNSRGVDRRGAADMAKFDYFIHCNAKNLILAARDTTASALTWFFWTLVRRPDVEAKVIAELKANWPSATSAFDRDSLGKLVYLHAALTETLRLYPPIPMQHKGVSHADVLPSGHAVRPGMMLLVPLYSMARMKSIWGPDCCEYRPERWIDERGEIKHEPPHKFFAFNMGPRVCLGKEIAYNKMKLVVAALLRNFEFELVEGHVAEPRVSIVLHMKNGLAMKLRKRQPEW